MWLGAAIHDVIFSRISSTDGHVVGCRHLLQEVAGRGAPLHGGRTVVLIALGVNATPPVRAVALMASFRDRSWCGECGDANLSIAAVAGVTSIAAASFAQFVSERSIQK